jgi:hypothetical protein
LCAWCIVSGIFLLGVSFWAILWGHSILVWRIACGCIAFAAAWGLIIYGVILEMRG